MSEARPELRALDRQVLAEMGLRREAVVSAAERAERLSHRVVLCASSVAAVIAVWDLGLLLRFGPG